MKRLTEMLALKELRKLKTDFQHFIKTNYETKAQSCAECPTKGACCLDAHFVNVRITRLEAAAIRKTLEKLSEEKQRRIYRRAEKTIEKYDLKNGGETFACPLFEAGVGCLVHDEAKPAACISHACYEKKEDLPPEEFQEEIENKIERLNRRTYGKNLTLPALPVQLISANPFSKND